MTDPVTIIIQGAPHGKGRPRFNGKTVYTPAETRNYERGVSFIASAEMRGRELMDGPLHIELRAVFAIPKSWSAAKRHQALIGEVRPAVKPDTDNILKAITDPCNGVVFRDDAQIVSVRASKVYGLEPLVIATIKSVHEEHNQGERV